VKVAETAAPNEIQFNGVGRLRTYIIFTHSALQRILIESFPVSNIPVSVAVVFFVVLASSTASFARAAGQEEATGHLGGGRPEAAAISALDNMSLDPSGIGNASKVAPIPPPRIRIPTIPHFR
jgi:hypothetical protein